MAERGNCNGIVYVIKEKDTLYQIAKQYNVRVRDIMMKNPYVNIYNLQIGDELCIPAAGPVISGAFEPYVVKEGDTLMNIMKNKNVSFEKLAKSNKSVRDLTLPAGTVLLIDKEK